MDNSNRISKQSAYNSIVAGYVAGITGLLIGHPLDSMKVLLQTQAAAQSTGPTAPKAALQLPTNNNGPNARQIRTNTTAVATELVTPTQRSFLSLYKGIHIPLMTVGVMQSLNFVLYDSFRRLLYQNDLKNNQSSGSQSAAGDGNYLWDDSLTNVAIASGTAGAFISLITSPMQVLKTKQQVMLWDTRTALRETMRNGGLRNFFTGFGAHFYCDTIGRAVYFASYECMKRHLREHYHDGSKNSDVINRMISAAASGMMCWFVIFPADVVRCKVYHHVTTNPGSEISSTEMIQKMFRESNGSLRPFMRGFGITVARAGPVAAAVLPVYDLTLEWLRGM